MGKEPKDKEIRRRYKTNDGHRNIKHTVKDKKKKREVLNVMSATDNSVERSCTWDDEERDVVVIS